MVSMDLNALEKETTSIVIETELIMYGYCEIRITKTDKETTVLWYSCDDGGTVVDQGSIFLDKKRMYSLMRRINTLSFSDFDEAESFLFARIQYNNSDNQSLLERNVFSVRDLKLIIDTIEKELSSKDPTICFRNLLLELS